MTRYATKTITIVNYIDTDVIASSYIGMHRIC